MKHRNQEPPAYFLEMELAQAIVRFNLELARKADRLEITHEEYLKLSFPPNACEFIDVEMDKAVDRWEKMGRTNAN